MPYSRPIDDPKHWHDRATELRVMAAEMKNMEVRRTMFRLADGYDELGDRALERQAGPKAMH